jgi:hypothetical protein
MLVMETPQFPTQDDSGFGSGIGSIPQWQLASMTPDSQAKTLDDLDVDPDISNVLLRLRSIFHQPWLSCLSNTELHDLTCFVVHRLLLLPPLSLANAKRAAISECLRYAMALYMLIIHGTTYYSHANLANTIILQLQCHLDALAQTDYIHGPLEIWILSVGMVVTIGNGCHRFTDQACAAAIALRLLTWEDVFVHLESILWLRTQQGEELFRARWEEIFKAAAEQT